MKEYMKHNLSRETIVPGGLRGFFQTYQWKLYEATEKYPPKVALYIYLKESADSEQPNTKQRYAKRSLYFQEPDHLKGFITSAVWTDMQLREIKYDPFVSIETARLMWLDKLLGDIREGIIKRWKKE